MEKMSSGRRSVVSVSDREQRAVVRRAVEAARQGNQNRELRGLLGQNVRQGGMNVLAAGRGGAGRGAGGAGAGRGGGGAGRGAGRGGGGAGAGAAEQEGFVLTRDPERTTPRQRQNQAIRRVQEERSRLQQLLRGNEDRQAQGAQALTRVAGLQFRRAGQTRELTATERENVLATQGARNLRLGTARGTFFETLRLMRDQYRQRVFQSAGDDGYANRRSVQNTNMLPNWARDFGYFDLVERMSRLRRTNFSDTSKIPVEDVQLNGRFNENIATIPQLAQAIVNAVRVHALQGDTSPRDLVSVTINNFPVTSFNGNLTTTTVFTGAVTADRGLGELRRRLEMEIEDAFQSGQGVDFDYLRDEETTILVQIIREPRARGWSPRLEVEEYFVKSTVRAIPPAVYLNDGICIPVALLTSAVRVTDAQGLMTTPEFEVMKLGDDAEEFEVFDTRQQTNVRYFEDKVERLQYMAYSLMEDAKITHDELCIDSCEAFATVLGVQIHILFQEAMCRRLLRYGDPQNPRSITILVREDHAFPVLKPWRLVGNGMPSVWCDSCHKCVTKTWSRDRVAHHRTTCHHHREEDPSKSHGHEFVCKRVNTLWHKKENRALTAPYCRTCEKFCMDKKQAQSLGGEEDAASGMLEDCMAQGHNVLDDVVMSECLTCGEVLPNGWPDVSDKPEDVYQYVNRHQCYLPKPELKVGESAKYYVWDIETIAVDDTHVPVYVYARNLYDETDAFDCTGMNEFCTKVCCDKYKGSTWIAHNSGGFDSNFVHSWLEDRGVMHTRIPSPMSMHRSLETVVDEFEIRFIDSFSFIPMALAKIGPAFNLPVVKGDFPHKFSKIEHLGYEGPMPPCDTEEDWYSLSTIRASSAEKGEAAIAKFKAWHEEEKKKYVPHTEVPWSYQQQLRSYCKKDCDVLAGALQCLRDSFLSADASVKIGSGMNAFCLCPVDPLCYLTMAQVCQQLYIAGMYAADTGFRIAHIPLPDRKQDKAKVAWLMREERKLGRTIWKACTHMREWIADDGLPVDGYVEVDGVRHVYEFYDCAERGCISCHAPESRNARYGCCNRDVYNKLVNRLAGLRKHKYQVHVRWQHEDADELVHDMGLTKYDCMVAQRQRNDGGFYGGRVEVFKPMWRCKEDEKIQYIDVVSLYPWVCATQKMCTGVPTIYFGDAVDMARMHPDHTDRYFGYAHVRVKGCEEDYFGGVPRKDYESGRLVFDNSEYSVTCFIDELFERMEHGAQVLEVYEVWHWNEYNAVDGPMAGYVSYFLRDKMECSGWKALCGREPETDAEKNAICDQLEADNLGLCRPRPERVADNPGGRQLAKLRLNMLWGKFVQTPKAVTLKFISTYEDYVKLWYDNQVDKSSLMFRRIHDDLDFMEVKYSHTSSLRAPSNTHYYMGGSCTAQARLKLTSMLRKVGEERALYCDTDSVVYVHREGDEVIETGEALGHWSSEMDEGVWGKEFLALAPKCYLLQYNDEGCAKEKESGILKAKGVTLTTENLKSIHADSMRKIILTEVFGDITGDDLPFVVQAKTFNIRMDHAGDRSMVNIHGEKVVRCVYSKRSIRVPDNCDTHDVHFIDTVPFC